MSKVGGSHPDCGAQTALSNIDVAKGNDTDCKRLLPNWMTLPDADIARSKECRKIYIKPQPTSHLKVVVALPDLR